MEVGFLEV